MKFFLFGLIAMALLFALNSHGQSYSKELLKSLEQEAISITRDTTILTLDKLKTDHNFDLDAIKAFRYLDSLLVFVNIKKQDQSTTFEATIVSFLEHKCNELELKSLEFTEDETLIYTSFLKVLDWNRTFEIIKLYEDFIVKSEKDQIKYEVILTVLSFIKYLHHYIKAKKSFQSEARVYQCVAENFEESNEIDWKVFALNPGKLIFWTIAACAWDVKSEK